MPNEIDQLKSDVRRLTAENAEIKKIIRSYENVLKLNEKELENADEIKKMYEIIVEFSRKELMQATETAKAQESASQLGRDELLQAFHRIAELEEENKKLRQQKSTL